VGETSAVRCSGSATDARVHFGEVLRTLAETGTDVIVERSGNPVAVMLSFDEFKRLKHKAGEDESQSSWWHAMVENAKRFRDARGDRPIVDATGLIREMREERDAELFDRMR